MSEHNVTDTSLKRTIMILLKLKQEQISKLQRSFGGKMAKASILNTKFIKKYYKELSNLNSF